MKSVAQPTLWAGTLLLFLAPSPILAQARPHTSNVTVNGQTGQALVVRINGKSYVDLEGLARISNGSVGFQPSGIILTLPASTPDSPPPNPPDTSAAAASPSPAADAAASGGFTKDFLRAGIDQMTVIREWRVALANAVETNFPVTEDWVSTYRRSADSKLALASAAVGSDADRQALPLLENEFSNLEKLSSRFLSLHDSQTFTPTTAIANDPLNQQVLSCARGLTALLATRQFQDVAACH